MSQLLIPLLNSSLSHSPTKTSHIETYKHHKVFEQKIEATYTFLQIYSTKHAFTNLCTGKKYTIFGRNQISPRVTSVVKISKRSILRQHSGLCDVHNAPELLF